MAELEGTLGSSQDFDANNNIKVETDWLDFDFVKDCNDKKKLTLIFNTLKTGREGHYPEVSIIIVPQFNYCHHRSIYDQYQSLSLQCSS
jgi:hypothetical protein